MKWWRFKLLVRLTIVKVLQWLGQQREVYYIGSSETLPPPLTVEEESYLINKLEAGEGAVRTVLIERNLRLVVILPENLKIPE